MTGCCACDEWICGLATDAVRPAEPAVRHCPACGRTVVAYDIRPSDNPEVDNVMPERQRARDAQGRIGEVMGAPQPGSALLSLRPVGGGLEWDVPADSITLVDADGEPLPQDRS